MQLLKPLILTALALPLSAQCEIARIDPAGVSYLTPSAGFSQGLMSLTGDGAAVSMVRLVGEQWVEVDSFVVPGWFLFMESAITQAGSDVFVGIPESSDLEGEVFIYAAPDYSQPSQILQPQTPELYDTFGYALAGAGDVLVVGAPMTVMDVLCGPGKAFIFERQAGVWAEAARFDPVGATTTMGNYAFCVATDGERVVVGSAMDDELGANTLHAGAVYVYARNEGTWALEAKLFPSDALNEPGLGSSVAIQGDLLVAGAASGGVGSVYTFEYAGGQWNETSILSPDDLTANARFGEAIDLEGDRLVVGAPLRESSDGTLTNVGGYYAYQREGSVWRETQKVVADDAASGAYYGHHVALDGDQVLWIGRWTSEARVNSLPAGGLTYCTSTPNSTGQAARIELDGCSRVSSGVTLKASSLPLSTGVFFYGPDQAAVPFGNGTRCVAGQIVRSAPMDVSAGALEWTIDPTVLPHTVLVAGSTWYAQAWYRDPAAGGFDLSDGIEFRLLP